MQDQWLEDRHAPLGLAMTDLISVSLIYMTGSADAFAHDCMSLSQIAAGCPLADGSLPYPSSREPVYT